MIVLAISGILIIFILSFLFGSTDGGEFIAKLLVIIIMPFLLIGIVLVLGFLAQSARKALANDLWFSLVHLV